MTPSLILYLSVLCTQLASSAESRNDACAQANHISRNQFRLDSMLLINFTRNLAFAISNSDSLCSQLTFLVQNLEMVWVKVSMNKERIFVE